jgi:hypothetical protein
MPEPSSDAAVRDGPALAPRAGGEGVDDGGGRLRPRMSPGAPAAAGCRRGGGAWPGPARGQGDRRRALALLAIIALGLALPAAARAGVVPGTPGQEAPAPAAGGTGPAVDALPDLGAAVEERVRDEAGRELSLRSLLAGRVTVLVLAPAAAPAGRGGVAAVPAAALLEGPHAAGVQFLAVRFGPADPGRRGTAARAPAAREEGAGWWRWRRLLAAAGAREPADGFGALLVDRGGRVRGWYGPGVAATGLVLADLRTLLAEEEA